MDIVAVFSAIVSFFGDILAGITGNVITDIFFARQRAIHEAQDADATVDVTVDVDPEGVIFDDAFACVYLVVSSILYERRILHHRQFLVSHTAFGIPCSQYLAGHTNVAKKIERLLRGGVYAAFFAHKLYRLDIVLYTRLIDFDVYTFRIFYGEFLDASPETPSLRDVVRLMFGTLDAHMKKQLEKKAPMFLTMQLSLLEGFPEVPYFLSSRDITEGRASASQIGHFSHSVIGFQFWTGLSNDPDISSRNVRAFRQCTIALTTGSMASASRLPASN